MVKLEYDQFIPGNELVNVGTSVGEGLLLARVLVDGLEGAVEGLEGHCGFLLSQLEGPEDYHGLTSGGVESELDLSLDLGLMCHLK